MSDNIKDRLTKIEKRNKRVEADKAWESSWTRKLAIAFLTYIVVCIYLKFVVGVDPWINAIVPTIGFLLSTLTLGWIKSYWLQKYDK
ncbi:hypothetical protein KC945_00460 [Candidatus Saccharibacteria bacterium]|nr:hypothetical protein [Candidatus Saccharibacteria bacterium]